MDINESPQAIAEILGARLKQARLNANISQEALALKIGVSKNTIVNAESGKTKLATMIAVMQGLELLDQLPLFLPEQPVSPIQLAKMKGKERQRASKKTIRKNNNKSSKTEPLW